jgi:hypothetical protein
MSILQITIIFVMAGSAIVGLFTIFRSLEKLAKGISSIGAELTKMNSKLEIIEAVNKDEFQKPAEQQSPELKAIETAISNFEKLKRVDLEKSQWDNL